MVKPRNAAEARDINELRQAAKLQMVTNSSITVYGMLDGCEVNRRPAYAWAGLHTSLAQFGLQLRKVGEAAEAMRTVIQKALFANVFP